MHYRMTPSYFGAALLLLCIISITEAKHKILAEEENGFNYPTAKKLINSFDSKEMEDHDDLKGKLSKAEKALEESINQLVKVGVEVFVKDTLDSSKHEEMRQRRIAMRKKNKKEYCHAKALVYCGKISEAAYMQGEMEGKLDFSALCDIKEKFLDCMTLMKSHPCEKLQDTDMSEEEFNHLRDRLMKRLKAAAGCTLPM